MKNSLNIVLVILVFIVLGCNCQKFQDAMKQAETNSTTTSSTPPTTGSSPATDAPKTSSLTLAKYNQIKEGMTHKEVSDILGSAGVEQMSSGTGKYKFTSYKWDGENYTFITVTFTNDKMTTKYQYGMK